LAVWKIAGIPGLRPGVVAAKSEDTLSRCGFLSSENHYLAGCNKGLKISEGYIMYSRRSATMHQDLSREIHHDVSNESTILFG
jgi:hypothetical protein